MPDIEKNAITTHIPIIILTACGLDEQKIEGFESGADAYISKPFNAEILKIRINKLIQKKENIQKHAGSEWLIGSGYKTLADDHKEFIDKLKSYVETHIQEEICVDELAGSLGLSKPKFYRKLKEITPFSPTQLINHIKLKRAAYLMLYERKTISEAAFASGFSSPSYFTKIFYKYYKQLPSEYIRRNNRQEHSQ